MGDHHNSNAEPRGRSQGQNDLPIEAYSIFIITLAHATAHLAASNYRERLAALCTVFDKLMRRADQATKIFDEPHGKDN